MNKLIPMTDFVLQEAPKFNPFGSDDQADVVNHILNYAKFLKLPLTISMFVPCDDGGNILETPKPYKPLCANPSEELKIDAQECYESDLKEYKKAKDKVLFEEFTASNEFLYHNGKRAWITPLKGTVESLVGYEIILTETAITQIFK